MSHRPPIPPHYPTITKRPITLPFPPPHIQYAVTDQSRGDRNDGWRLTCGLSEARMETHKSHEWGSEIVPTRSSWLNCALRDDEAVYWVSIGHYAVGN